MSKPAMACRRIFLQTPQLVAWSQGLRLQAHIHTGPQLLSRGPYANSESRGTRSARSYFSCSGCGALNLPVRSSLGVPLCRNITTETYSKYLSPESPPIGLAQDFLETFRDTTGLPWWASIAVSTFLLRTAVTLPLSVYSMHVMARVERLQPEIMQLSKELKREVAMAVKKFGWSEKKARAQYNHTMKKLVAELYIRDNCHPFKSSLVLWFQIPMWISLSFALRNMSGAVPVIGLESPVLCPELQTEGLLWFPDLTVPDATWLLPLSLGLINLLNVEVSTLQKGVPSKFQKFILYLLRGLSIVIIPIGAVVPSSMCYYWTCSSVFGLLQNVVLKLPRVRRIFRVPQSPSHSDTPLKDMYDIAKEKYSFRRRTKTR